MIVRPAFLPVLPEPSIFFQAVDRPGIRIPFVERPDFLGPTKQCRMVFFLLAHDSLTNGFNVYVATAAGW
jgi:hypothetical protein